VKKRRRRGVPKRVARFIWGRDEGHCQYVDPETGKKCGSTYGLQLDHIVPIKDGGETVASNLRLLCAAHNRYRNRADQNVADAKPENQADSQDEPL
jgi:5-methylcytosine-specific restriction endonuclease McrA